MEILKHGNVIKKAECLECHCVFTYNKTKDVRNMYKHSLDYYFVRCPECNTIVKVDKDGN